MPIATQNVYSIFVFSAPLRLNNLYPTCQFVARSSPTAIPHFAPQLGKIFPITEMYKCTQSARRLFTGFVIPALAANPATVTHAIPAIPIPASPNTHHSSRMRK